MRRIVLLGVLLVGGLASSAPAKLPALDLVYVDDGTIYAGFSTDRPASQTGPNETNTAAANRRSLNVKGSQPSWAPGGTRIVFVKRLGTKSSELWTVGVDGKGVRRLTHPPAASLDSQPAWSPTGSQIAFTRSPVGGNTYSELWVVGATGAGAKRLATALPGRPSWSPDGSRLAFNSSGVSVIAVDGTGLKTLGRAAVGPSWAPDGGSIAASCGGVCLFDPAGGASRKITATSGALTIRWRPDSKRLAFLVCCSKSALYDTAVDLYTVGAGGQGLQRLVHGLGPGDELKNLTAAWSSGGTSFAYVSTDPAIGDEIVVSTGGGKGKLVGTGYDFAWRP